MAKSKFSAEDFCNPDNFRTAWPHEPGRAEHRYQKGLMECEDYVEIYIGINDTVSAKLASSYYGTMQGYEKLGYHACSDQYLRAILDSGKPVWVYRVDDDGRIAKYDLRALHTEHLEFA